MWIFDSYHRGHVKIWGRDEGPRRTRPAYPLSSSIYISKIPNAHWVLLEGLEKGSLYVRGNSGTKA